MVRKTLSIAMSVAAGAFLSASAALAQTGYKTTSPEKPKADTSMSTSGDLSHADASFLKKAAAGGAREVELGKLASEKASNPDVKAFGKRMADDHGKADEDLQKLALQKGLDVTMAPSVQTEREKEKLSKLSGADFDREYMKLMVSDHEKDVAEFAREARSAKDADVRSFCSDKLPTLREHLNMARTDQSKIASHSTRKGTAKAS